MKGSSLLFVLIGLVLFVACSSSGNVDTAVRYLNALEQGDVDTATQLVCPERADMIMSGLRDVSPEERGSFSFENVSCAARGSGVACRYTIVQQTTEETPQEFERNVVFDFEDDLICGFEEEVAP